MPRVITLLNHSEGHLLLLQTYHRQITRSLHESKEHMQFVMMSHVVQKPS